MTTLIPMVSTLVNLFITGKTPVDAWDAYTAQAAALSPALSIEEKKAADAETRARIQFAWETAREDSLKMRAAKKTATPPTQQQQQPPAIKPATQGDTAHG
jgi:hypothetical protein